MGEPGTGSAGWTRTTGYRVDRSSAPNSIGSIRTSSAVAKTSGPINHARHRHRATTHHAIDVNATSSSADQSYALKADRRSSYRPQRNASPTWSRSDRHFPGSTELSSRSAICRWNEIARRAPKALVAPVSRGAQWWKALVGGRPDEPSWGAG